MPTASTTATDIADISSAWVTAFFDYSTALFTNTTFVGVMVALVVLYFGINLVRRKVGV